MKFKVDIYSAFLHVCLVVLAVLVFYLAKENQKLKGNASIPQVSFKKGDMAKKLLIRTFAGTDSTIDFSQPGKKTILFVFSTNCPHCKEVSPYIEKLYEKFKDNFQFVGVAVEETQEIQKFVAEKKLHLPVFRSAPKDLRASIPVSFVPITILLDKGYVEEYWAGNFADDGYDKIQLLLKKN
ncbi:MAG: TlpA family protein disulfide reductase [Ignavibacteriales bacterium]|nr:TlpA family protein disulfide reductase [Ignavibacteriales bacterium]